MLEQRAWHLLRCMAFLNGCVTETVGRPLTAARPPKPTIWEKLAAGTESITKPFKGKKQVPESWAWGTGIPQGATRADLVRAVVPATHAVQFAKDFRSEGIQLASANSAPDYYEIRSVGDTPVKNYDDLHQAVERHLTDKKPVRVVLAEVNAPAEVVTATASFAPAALERLEHATADDQTFLRVHEDGNPWVVLREKGVHGKVMVKAERRTGLLQVFLSVGVGEDLNQLLPVEVKAECNGKTLQCLSTAATLETLYGETPPSRKPVDPIECSFAAVSEKDDYLIPTNYQRLQESTTKSTRKRLAPPYPALVSLPGLAYPGPALLGDARALSAFLMQKQNLRSDAPDRLGWIIFSGETLKTAEQVTLTLDLGNGSKVLSFMLPEIH